MELMIVAVIGLASLLFPQGKGRRNALWTGLWVGGALLPYAKPFKSVTAKKRKLAQERLERMRALQKSHQ